MVITISIDDNVSAHRQGVVNAVMELAAQSDVTSMQHEIFDTEFLGDFNRLVGRGVIHDLHDNFINTFNFFGYALEHQRESGFFVVTGYLDD